MYISRVAESLITRYLKSFPALGVTGPRQSGKSTCLQHLLKGYQYITFDDFQQVEFFEDDPKGFMASLEGKVIFDEVQFVPKLFNLVKIAIDEDRQNYGRFVLTGSSQFAYLKKASESLAGRIGLMSLLPLQYSEVPKEQQLSSIYRGGYPELVTRNYFESDLWYSTYLETYLNKDLRVLSNIGDLRDFRRFLQLLAAQVTQLLDMSAYARDIGVSVPTIKRWISILEASYIIFLLPPYYENFGRRIIKSPKVYFYDNGLVSYLTGIKTRELYEKGPLAGPLFENYVVCEVMKKIKHTALNSEIYYLKTSEGAEVDLIVDHKITKDFIEIKKSSTFTPKMVATLKSYCQVENITGYLLYNGDEFRYQDNIKILNYSDYLLKQLEVK
jgi:predicted AAA+ superfamily ATPase